VDIDEYGEHTTIEVCDDCMTDAEPATKLTKKPTMEEQSVIKITDMIMVENEPILIGEFGSGAGFTPARGSTLLHKGLKYEIIEVEIPHDFLKGRVHNKRACKCRLISPVAKLTKRDDGDHLTFLPPGHEFPITLPVIQKGSRKGTNAWTWNGDLEKPTLLPSIKSTLSRNGPVIHLWLNDGECCYLNDSDKHAGETLPLIPLEEKWLS
jgi:hypothetical protein